MTEKRADAASAPGPQRWKYRQYSIHERALPFGRRFEVRSPQDELVLYCRVKKSEPNLVFYADDKESQQLFRFEPEHVHHYQRSYAAIDALTDQPFAHLRKKEYEPAGKMEWFIFDADGEQVGLIMETAPEPTLLRRIVPVDRLFPKAWAIHWKQAVVGHIQPKAGIVGERLDVDLEYDTKDEIDRRLVLGATVALRADLHGAEAKPPDEAAPKKG